MTKFSNELNDAQTERLAILIEELGEAQQAVGKILRHGYDSYNPLLPPDEDGNPVKCNRDDLEKELGDIRYAIGLLSAAGDIQEAEILRYRDEKHEKIQRYLHHQCEAQGKEPRK